MSEAMTAPPLPDRATLTRLTEPQPLRDALADAVQRGLTGPDKWLEPIFFYDARGSELFDRITELDKYYLTRTEASILARHGDALVAAVGPDELVEIGSGSSSKTPVLLDALRASGGTCYVPLDISESALVEAAERLTTERDWLTVEAYVADFHRDLAAVPRHGRRVVAFLGSTLGNLVPHERKGLLADIRTMLAPGDGFLLGVDLVKGEDVLLPAYDDAQGVTAEFNRNVLHVINRELDGDLPVDAFEHRVGWNHDLECVDLELVATRDIAARLRAIDLDLSFESGESILTEHSCKFRLPDLTQELAQAGLCAAQIATDPEERFAVVLALPADLA